MKSEFRVYKSILFFLLLGSFSACSEKLDCPDKLVCELSPTFLEHEKESLQSQHQKLLEVYDIDYRVVISEDEQEINQFSNKSFEQLKIGSRSASNRGLLLVVNKEKDLVRLEVGPSLEPIYTDAFVSYLQNRQMVPFFEKGLLANGILATTELIVTRAEEAKSGAEFLPPAAHKLGAKSIGGGAVRSARISKGKKNSLSFQSKTTKFTEDLMSPQQVVDAYHKAMANRDARPDLEIYSVATKKMMSNWVMTPAQMDNLAKTMKSCKTDKVLSLLNMAVVRFPVAKRSCSPYFLLREEKKWKLDLTVMSKLIRFNHKNNWHFDRKTFNPFSFAFGDWTLDRNGYPHEMQAEKLRWQLSFSMLYDGNTYVTWVGEGSPAEAMGFEFGDRILSFAGSQKPNPREMNRLLGSLVTGKKIKAEVFRSNQELVLSGLVPAKVEG